MHDKQPLTNYHNSMENFSALPTFFFLIYMGYKGLPVKSLTSSWGDWQGAQVYLFFLLVTAAPTIFLMLTTIKKVQNILFILCCIQHSDPNCIYFMPCKHTSWHLFL